MNRMKNRLFRLLIACILPLLLSCPAAAEDAEQYTGQQLETSGAAALWDALTADTRALYHAIGVDSLSDLGDAALDPPSLFSALGQMLAKEGRQPLAVAGILLAAVVLCAYLRGTRETVSDAGLSTVYQQVSVLTVCAVLLPPLADCVRTVRDALSGAAVFMGSFSPVYIAVLAAGGQMRAALSYQSVLLFFSQVLSFLTGGVLMPVLLAAVAMGMVSAASDAGNLGKIGEMLLKGVTWTLGVMAALFTALLSVNSMLGAAEDTLGNKMIRLSLSSFVPVVGGAVSEAYLTVRSCLTVVKTTVGAFGILTTVMLLLPAIIRCVCWQLCLWGCQMAAEAFDQKTLAGFFKVAAGAARAMIAALSVCAVFMIVATTIVALAGRGAA